MPDNEITPEEIDALMPWRDMVEYHEDHESEEGWSRDSVHATVRAVLSAPNAARWLPNLSEVKS